MEIIATKVFLRCAKSIAKKYRGFNSDYQALIKALSLNPKTGTDLGGGYRKVRMIISSKNKGKSGGCRVITLNTVERNGCLYLIYIYDKSEYDSVNLSIIKTLVEDLELDSSIESSTR